MTNAKGQYGFYPLPVGRPFAYRVVWPGNASYTGSVSPVRTPAVRAVASLLSLRDDSIYMDPGTEVVAQAMVYPGLTGRPVFLRRYDATSNSFRNIGFRRAPSDRRFTLYGRVGGSVPLVATGGRNHPVFSVWPASKDTLRRSSWADIDVAGCKWVTAWFEGGADMGGRTRVQVIVGGKVVVNTSVYGDGQNDWHTYTLNVLGRRTIRMQVSDIDTKTGPRAILRPGRCAPADSHPETGRQTRVRTSHLAPARRRRDGRRGDRRTGHHRIGRHHRQAPVGRPFAYRVVWPGNAAYAGSVSPTRTPAVRPYVGIANIADDYPLGDGDDLYADLKFLPEAHRHARLPAAVRREVEQLPHIGFGRQQSSRFGIAASLAGSTGYFRVYAPAFGGYSAGYSAVRRYVHYSERGGFKRPVRATGGTNHPVISVFPPAKDPYRARAGAWAGKGGSAWVDLDITGCKWVQLLPDGLDTAGGRTKFEALIDGEVRYESELSHSGTEYIFPFPELYVGGERTLRLRVSDIDTDSGPRAILKVYSHCSS